MEAIARAAWFAEYMGAAGPLLEGQPDVNGNYADVDEDGDDQSLRDRPVHAAATAVRLLNPVLVKMQCT